MKKTIEDYLSIGCDQATAEYFLSGRKKILKVAPNADFTLTISFDNGEQRLYDVKPLLKKGTVFESFMDMENFNRVYVDDCGDIAWDIDPNIDSSEIWNNKVDLCTDSCYIHSVPLGGDTHAD